MTSNEKMDNEGIKNKGNLSHFTLGNWEKLPTEADNNNNDECLWIEEKCSYRPLSRVETGSSTKKDTDVPDAPVVKKTTEIRVHLCPPKTSVRLKSPPSVNTVAPLHILPLSNAGEVYLKKECFGNETSREISDEENGRKHRMSKVDDNTSCLIADTIVGYVSKHNISDNRITRLAAREVSINPSKDDLNIASNSPRKPVFLSPLKDEECIAGKPLTLGCEVIGWPEPKVFWKFDGLSLDGQEHYVSEYNGRVAILQLPDLHPSDEGTYTCVAQNKAGQAETKANLTVEKTDKISLSVSFSQSTSERGK
ncbi:MYLK [Acanthosepion pharaonis]|uniref:MYLK n=1 Tax=Acanthosepion pharaonis TaxID=158019 RepID=A0A812AR13_ACAPH|nr:MYLK [Sepia pharaonis]